MTEAKPGQRHPRAQEAFRVARKVLKRVRLLPAGVESRDRGAGGAWRVGARTFWARITPAKRTSSPCERRLRRSRLVHLHKGTAVDARRDNSSSGARKPSEITR